MRTFDHIIEMAVEKHGGEDNLEKLMAQYEPPSIPLEMIPDDRYLSQMARGIFQSGFSWKVIESKWDGFEAAFDGFNPHIVSFYSDEDLDRLVSDTRIVRNGRKIQATIHNAKFVVDIAGEHGSFGAFLSKWHPDDQVGLLEVFKKRGKHLSGNTGSYFLRFMGWDSFILSGDVVTALIREGVVDKAPTSKSAMQAVQEAFNEWCEDSGLAQRDVSKLLAFSVG